MQVREEIFSHLIHPRHPSPLGWGRRGRGRGRRTIKQSSRLINNWSFTLSPSSSLHPSLPSPFPFPNFIPLTLISLYRYPFVYVLMNPVLQLLFSSHLHVYTFFFTPLFSEVPSCLSLITQPLLTILLSPHRMSNNMAERGSSQIARLLDIISGCVTPPSHPFLIALGLDTLQQTSYLTFWSRNRLTWSLVKVMARSYKPFSLSPLRFPSFSSPAHAP